MSGIGVSAGGGGGGGGGTGGPSCGGPIFVYRSQGAFGSMPCVASGQCGGKHLFSQPFELKPMQWAVLLQACATASSVVGGTGEIPGTPLTV